MWGEARAVELAGLFLRVAFGHQDEPVTRGQIRQCLGDAGKKLDLVVGDRIGEAVEAAVLLVGDGGAGELFEAIDQRAAEAAKTVTVGSDGGVLAVVQMLANLDWSVDLVVEVGDERGDGALEVDIVLPECVVGVDQESVTGRAEGRLREIFHGSIVSLCGLFLSG